MVIINFLKYITELILSIALDQFRDYNREETEE